MFLYSQGRVFMSEVNKEEINFDIKNRNFSLKKSDFKENKKEQFLFDYLTKNNYNKLSKSDSKYVAINMLDKEEGTKGTITQQDINIFLEDEKVKKKDITQKDLINFINKMYKLNPTADEKILNQVSQYKDETGKPIMTPELKEIFGFEHSDISKKIADPNGNVQKGMEIFDLNNDGKIDYVEKDYQTKNGIGNYSKITNLYKYLEQLDKNSTSSGEADSIITKEDKQKAYDKAKNELDVANHEKMENSSLKDENGNNIVTKEIKAQFNTNNKIAFKDIIDNNGNIKKGFEIFDLNGDGKIDNKEKGYFSAAGHFTDKSQETINVSEFLNALIELDKVGYVESAGNNIENKTITTQDKKALYKILESGVYMLENMKNFSPELQQEYADVLKEQCLYNDNRQNTVGRHIDNMIALDTESISKPEIASVMTHELTHALLDNKMPALQQEVVTFFMEYKLYSEAQKNDPNYFEQVDAPSSTGIKTIGIDKDYMNFIDTMKNEHPEMSEKDIAVEAFLKYKLKYYNGKYQKPVSADYIRNLDYSAAEKFFETKSKTGEKRRGETK